MGLGRLFTRSTQITSRDTVTGATAVFTIVDNIAPDFASPGAYRGGMEIPGAWRAAVMLSDLLGQVPWDAFRSISGQPEEKLIPKPPLLEQPEPPFPLMKTISSWGLDYFMHGNAVGVVAARNALGWPVACVPVSAASVGVRRVPPGDTSTQRRAGSIEYSIGSERFGSEDIIHIVGPCEPGALRGMGVLENHFNTLKLAREQSKQASAISAHGVPTGVLKSDNPDLTEAEAVDLKASWMASQRNRTVAVLNASTSFAPLSWNPEELELVEARKFTLTELELIFGLPPGWLGGMNSSRQYSNIEQDAVNLLKFSLGGPLARFEQTLSLHLPRGTVARADLKAVLRSDTLTRYQAHKIGLDSGFLTVDEVRETEHLPPMPDKIGAPPDVFDSMPDAQQMPDAQMPDSMDRAGGRRARRG